MNYQKLFEAQRKLDEHIIEKKQLQGQDLFNKTVESLLCEIQEIANEERSWKFWSNNRERRTKVSVVCPSCDGIGIIEDEACLTCTGGTVGYENPLLEETADSFHFILSIGNSLNIDPSEVEKQPARVYEDVTEQFLALSYAVVCMAIFADRKRYYFETISLFKGLLSLLNISNEQLEKAYYEKNKVNYERQESNY